MLGTVLALAALLACAVALAWPWLPLAARQRWQAAARAGWSRLRLQWVRAQLQRQARRQDVAAAKGARDAIERARRAARDTQQGPADNVSQIQTARERREAQKRRH